MARDSREFQVVVTLSDLAATTALGVRIAAGLDVGDCVALEGDLGAGKTTLARDILRALGVEEHVPSPTFTLVSSYDTQRLHVSHYDLYRVENPEELEELGIEEAVDRGAVLVEWPERAQGRLPGLPLRVALASAGQDGRTATLSGAAKWARILLEPAGDEH
jgi:tRNA threonylcarbamoyl adenosine modification protein YjeE